MDEKVRSQEDVDGYRYSYGDGTMFKNFGEGYLILALKSMKQKKHLLFLI